MNELGHYNNQTVITLDHAITATAAITIADMSEPSTDSGMGDGGSPPPVAAPLYERFGTMTFRKWPTVVPPKAGDHVEHQHETRANVAELHTFLETHGFDAYFDDIRRHCGDSLSTLVRMSDRSIVQGFGRFLSARQLQVLLMVLKETRREMPGHSDHNDADRFTIRL